MTKNIDVHWHHVPKPFVKAVADGKVPLKGRYQLDENGAPEIKVDLGFREFTQELPPELSEVDAAIEHMDRVGLDVVAASVAPPLMQYLASAEDGLKISQVLNDSMAEVTSAHPDRFAPLANVPLQAPEAAAAELRRAVTELGFAGAQISTQVAGQNLGDRDLRPFWKRSPNWTRSSSSILLRHHSACARDESTATTWATSSASRSRARAPWPR